MNKKLFTLQLIAKLGISKFITQIFTNKKSTLLREQIFRLQSGFRQSIYDTNELKRQSFHFHFYKTEVDLL